MRMRIVMMSGSWYGREGAVSAESAAMVREEARRYVTDCWIYEITVALVWNVRSWHAARCAFNRRLAEAVART